MTIRADTAQLFRQAYENAYGDLGQPVYQDFVQIINKQTSDWFIERMQSEHLSVKNLEEKTLQKFNDYEIKLATFEKRHEKTLEIVENDLHMTRQLRVEVRDDLHKLQEKYDILQSQMDVLMKERSQNTQKSEQSKVMINIPGSIHSQQSIDLRKSNMHIISQQNDNYNFEDERLNIQRPKRAGKPNQEQLSQEIIPNIQSQRSFNIMDPNFRLLSVSNRAQRITSKKDALIDRVNQIIYCCEPIQGMETFVFCTSNGQVSQCCSSVDQKTLKHRVLWEIWLSESVLCVDFNEKQQYFYVGLESGTILAIQKDSKMKIEFKGTHNAPICGLYWMENRSSLMTLGFDKSLKFWSEQVLTLEIDLPLKTATCAFSEPWLLIGSCEETIKIINLKQIQDIRTLTPNQYQKVDLNVVGKLIYSKIHGESRTAVLQNINGDVFVFNYAEESNEGIYDISRVCVIARQKGKEDEEARCDKGRSIDIACINSKIVIAIGESHCILLCDPNKIGQAKRITSPKYQVGPSSAVKFSSDCKSIAVGVINKSETKQSELISTKMAKPIIMNLKNIEL